jgi:WD40 repeat protein
MYLSYFTKEIHSFGRRRSGVITVASLDDPLDVSCLTGHVGAVPCLSYDPQGEYLVLTTSSCDTRMISQSYPDFSRYKASTGADGTARLWNLRNGHAIELHVAPRATFVDWHPSGMCTCTLSLFPLCSKTDLLLSHPLNRRPTRRNHRDWRAPHRPQCLDRLEDSSCERTQAPSAVVIMLLTCLALVRSTGIPLGS